MKTLRQLCAGLILALALTTTASAGKIDCPGIAAQSTEQVSAEGKMDCPGVTDILLGLIGTVLL